MRPFPPHQPARGCPVYKGLQIRRAGRARGASKREMPLLQQEDQTAEASPLLSDRARRVLPSLLKKGALLLLAVLAAVQFVGSYIYLEFPWVNLRLWEDGSERLPFQTRLLLAPLYRWVDHSTWAQLYAAKLARNTYFFPPPRGVNPGLVLEFAIGVVCVLVSGWVALRIYEASTRRGLLRPLVYPLFLAICVLLYIVHTVQNFRYVYDMPSLLLFALGFYVIYFRKPLGWFVVLFALGTLNRETTLLLLPFWALAQVLGPKGRIRWKGLLGAPVLLPVLAMGVYWAAWHRLVFELFGANPSEYFPRFAFNLYCFGRLRYWPQLAAAFAYLWPFLIAYRREVRDPLLRAWLLVLPIWYAFMFEWAIVTETRVFGELAPFLAPVAALIAEEVFAARVLGSGVHVDAAEARPRWVPLQRPGRSRAA